MAKKSRAVVQTAPRKLEMRELPLPEIDADSALLRVEACGICGSDAEQYAGVLPARVAGRPRPRAARHHRADRRSRREALGRRRRRSRRRRDVDPLRPLPRLHRGALPGVSRPRRHVRLLATCRSRTARALGRLRRLHVPRSASRSCTACARTSPRACAVMFNPLGAGFRWAVEIPETGPGDTVLVLGPGQRGLASVIAARAAGADRIIVTGLARDAQKLALARELGADHVIDVENEDARRRVQGAHRRPRRRRRRRGVVERARAGRRGAPLRRDRRPHRARGRQGLQERARLRERSDRRQGGRRSSAPSA